MNVSDAVPSVSSLPLVLAMGVAWLLALVSVAVGRNLTRSIAAAVGSLVTLALVFFTTLSRMPTGLALSSGVGLGSFVALVVATLVLMLVQLFGWMLVDVDRDHLPATDRGTRLARSLAFLVVGGGLVLLGWGVSAAFAERTTVTPGILAAVDAGIPLGTVRDFAILAGLALSASLLASLMLLRDDGEER